MLQMLLPTEEEIANQTKLWNGNVHPIPFLILTCKVCGFSGNFDMASFSAGPVPITECPKCLENS